MYGQSCPRPPVDGGNELADPHRERSRSTARAATSVAEESLETGAHEKESAGA
jgi:hypothetical protein